MSQNWNSHDDEILINFVKNHEEIYNIKCKGYRNTQYKLALWSEIGAMLNKTGCDCSKRWVYVRDYYIRRKGKPGIASSGEAAKKRADLLSFLDSLPSSQRNNITCIVEDENKGDENEVMRNTQETIEGIQPYNSETQDEPYDKNDDENKLDSNNDASNKDIASYRYINYDKKRKMYSRRRISLLKRKANRNPSTEDENDLFFRSMAKIVKKLPRYEQAQIRMQIGSIVGNAELRYISNNSLENDAFSPSPNSSVEYLKTEVPSPKPSTSTNEYSKIVVPSPIPTITVNDQGQIILFGSSNKITEA